MKFLLLICLAVLASCNNQQSETPEAALKDFVDSRVGQIVDRQFVLTRVTGKLLQNLQSMSEDDFSKFSNMKNIKTDSFKILTKNCEKTTCSLTYSVGYTTSNLEKAQFVSEVEKVAQLIQIDRKWLIAEVSNVKTFHESLEPINPLQ